MCADEGVGVWPQIQETARVHSTVVIADGMKYVRDAHGRPRHQPHKGGIVIGKHVYVGPHTVLHRARLPWKPTKIHDWVQIGALNNIGHHVEIGQNTIITQGVCVGGSAKIGENCFLGMNCTIRQHVIICDNTFIGMGAVVTKSIDEPGVYYGNPAGYQGPWDGTW